MTLTASTSKNSLFFYPTSPVHLRSLSLIIENLPEWKVTCIISTVAVRMSPGIPDAVEQFGCNCVVVEIVDQLPPPSVDEKTVLMLGAAFEPFAMELFAWAKRWNLPVVAAEEVAQLSLNSCELNNYDVPLDLFFVANKLESDLFQSFGFPGDSLVVTGLLSWEALQSPRNKLIIRAKFGSDGGKKLLVYTTSPLRSRITIHNKDDYEFRCSILSALAEPAILASWDVVIKLHPNENLEAEGRQIRNISPSFTVVGRDVDTFDLLAAADAVINRGNSETILDAVIMGLPTIVVSCGIRTIFHEFEDAVIVENPQEISTALKRVELRDLPDSAGLKALYEIPPEGVAACIAHHLCVIAGQDLPLTDGSLEWLVKSYLFLGMMDRLSSLFKVFGAGTPLLKSIEQAVNNHLDGNIQGAIIHWQIVSSLAPDWFYPHYELAHGNLAAGDWQASMEHAALSIELHPPFHFLWHEVPMEVVKSAALRGMGRAAEALAVSEMFDVTREVSAYMPELLIERAAIWLELADKDKATDLLKRSLAVLKDYPLWPSVDSLFHHRIGLLFRDMAEIEQAIACFSKALELSPDNFWAKFELAHLVYHDRNFDFAATLFKEIEGNPLLNKHQQIEIKNKYKLSTVNQRWRRLFIFNFKEIKNKFLGFIGWSRHGI